jgi:hypothetical protein
MFGMEQAAVEGHAERRILVHSVRQASGLTRERSPRQLPTDHDYDGVPLRGRSANIRVINRRASRFDCRLLHPGPNDERGVAA